MVIVLESVGGADDHAVANLSMVCKDVVLARIQLPVDAANADPYAVGERLRDISEYLVDWTRKGGVVVDAERGAPPSLPRRP